MAGPNTAPIYSRVGDVQWARGAITANTTDDLTSGTTYTVFTADSTNGGRVEKLRFQGVGTNVASNGKIWVNNGSTTGTAANNCCIGEVTLPATTNNEASAIPVVEYNLGITLPPGYVLYVTLGTTVSAGYDISAWGGKY
jgi:hypothetical protein